MSFSSHRHCGFPGAGASISPVATVVRHGSAPAIPNALLKAEILHLTGQWPVSRREGRVLEGVRDRVLRQLVKA